MGEQRMANQVRASGRRQVAELMRPRPIPPKYYRIGELVEYAGLSRQTIHNYTTMGLLRESSWTKGGHRLYDENVFARLDLIARLKARRASLDEIKDAIRQFAASQDDGD